MNIQNKKLYDLMVEKSKQSFLLAVELFNKPTIKLNVEGFCIFMCNAWELMLKSYLLTKNQSIYYKDSTTKKQQRSYDLSKLIKLVFTNSNDPLRVNLETVVGIRNKATHLIIPEYAALLHDVFSACTYNYCKKMFSLLNINISDLFSSTYLSLVIPTNDTNYTILGRYGKQIDDDYYNVSKYLDESYKRFSENDNVNNNLAIKHQIAYVKVKNKDEANIKIANFKDDESRKAIEIIKIKDPSETHPLSRNKLISLVKEELKKNGLDFTPYTLSQNKTFTSDTFNLFVKTFNVKNNPNYSYEHVVGNNKQYTYSYELVERIITEISNDKNLFLKCKKTNPRGNGNS